MRDQARFLAVRTLAALAAAFLVSLLVFRQATIDRGFEFNKPDQVAAIGRTSPGYLTMSAERRFAAGDPAAALGLAQRALVARPASPAALRLFGLAMERRGQPELAGQAISLAGLWGWRDPITQLWLMTEAGKRADLSNMLIHADALLRTEGPSRRIFALIAAAMGMRGGPELVGARLEDNPDWREGFFYFTGKSAIGEAPAMIPLAATMRATSPMKPEEIAPMVNALFVAGREQEAYALWRQTVAADGYAPGNAVFDAGFEKPMIDTWIRPSSFYWTILKSPGLDIGVRQAPAKDGRALYVRFGGEEGTTLMRQDLMVASGPHELRMTMLRENGGAPVAWTLSCRGFGKLDLSGDEPTASGAWGEQIYRFNVPPGCASVTLKLDGMANGGSANGTTWIDDVRVTS